MTKNPVLDLSLSEVIRQDIAMILSHVHGIHTVGAFLRAWRSPSRSQVVIQAFDSPSQARHAAATCAHFLGVRTQALPAVPTNWWTQDTDARASA